MRLFALSLFVFSFLITSKSRADFTNSNNSLWIGAFSKQSQRMVTGPCEKGVALDGADFTVNHWDLTRATGTYLCFEVYVKSITDTADSNPATLVVDVELKDENQNKSVVERVQYAGKRGNNFVYALPAEDLGLNHYVPDGFKASLSVRVRSRLFNIGDSVADDLIRVKRVR